MNSRLLPWVIVLVAALAYPIATLAGGGPHFPTRSECVAPATHDGDLEVVFGYFDSETRAIPFLRRVLGAGFKGSLIERNACGRVKVAVHGIPTIKVGEEVIAEARSVGLKATLEQVG